MRKLAVFVLVVLTVSGSAASAGQESIRVDVNLVNVAFSVRDANGSPIDNLTKDDFEVVEDTVPQKIAYFARSVDVPLTLGLIVDASGSQEHYTKKQAWKRYDKDTKHFLELGPPEERDLGTAFYDSIYYPVTEKLARENGRRALLVFSDGEDNSSSHDMMTAIEAAQSANVLVFTIRYTEKEHGKLTARNQYGIRVMDRIAKETGGTHIDAETTDPHTYFRQIAEELRTSYELAYYPTSASKDDTFRKVVIRPKQAGLKVRSKTGYFSR